MVELQITRTMSTTHAETNGMDETIAINQNGNNSSDENLENVNFSDEPREPVPNKRTKFDVPAFMQKQPTNVTWRPIEQPKPIKTLGIESVCPNICFFFLRDDCVEGEKCYYLHELPPDSEVSQALAECGVKDASKLLTVVIARCPKLLQQYFHVFVTFFAEQKAKDELIDAVGICERETDKEKQFQYFQYLINALIRIGEPYAKAMEIVYWRLNFKKQKEVVDTLLNMNLVDGIGVCEFLDVFKSLNEHRFQFNAAIVNRLLLLCTQSENVLPVNQLSDFARLIFDILRNNKRKKVHTALDKTCYSNYVQLYNRVRRTR